MRNLSTLTGMLRYMRPHGSGAELVFRMEYLKDLPGITEDAYGNLHLKIGTSPILWSSHTDTVHRKSGYQTLRVNEHEKTIRLSRSSKRAGVSCLGADDTVGVFLMREMILRKVPGYYIFHYGEEAGGIGSSALSRNFPAELNHVLFAIALDRQGTSDVVTHQSFGRTASDTFARSLAVQLPGWYAPAQGIYTDTAEYADIIPECSNISVGYYHQHSAREYVDYAHVERLLEALCTLNQDALICLRDPTVREEIKPLRYSWDEMRDDPLWHYPSERKYKSSPVLDDRDDDPAWCYDCEAPILAEDEDYPADGEFCVCGELEQYAGLTEDDIKFLRYLKGL